MLGAWLAIPLISLACMYQKSFWLSMALTSLTIFVSGSYFSPAITMMQNSVSKENYGNVVGAYNFITSLIQPLVPAFFGILASYYGAFKRPSVYGPLIAAFISFGYGLSGFFYWRAGIAYSKMMKRRNGEISDGQTTPTFA